MNKKLRSAVAFMLCLALMFSAAGCSNDNNDNGRGAVIVNEPVSSGTKWIDSSIKGAIDDNLTISPKDDFYTAVNKDWILTETVDEDNPVTGILKDKQDILEERVLSLLDEDNLSDGGKNPIGIPENILSHDEELIIKFASFAADWDERNTLGAEPLRPYIEAISGITDIDGMTEYLTNQNTKKLIPFFPASITVAPTSMNHDMNIVTIGMADNLLLNKRSEYSDITVEGRIVMETNSYVAHSVLERLGCSSREVNKLIKRCYSFESKLANLMNNATHSGIGDTMGALTETENIFSFDELKETAGNYPLADILVSLGYESGQDFCVQYPKYITGLGGLYTEKYFEDIKAYYIIHTAVDSAALLDRQLFDDWQELTDLSSSKEKNNESLPDETADTGKDTETKILMDYYINPYLSDPMGAVYAARFCTDSQKERISLLTDEIIKGYKDIFLSEDWLSDEVKTKSIEKLDCITTRILYPDEFRDYSGLELENCDNIIDAVSAISCFKLMSGSLSADTPYNRTEWDLSSFPTTVVNACYIPSQNSINIFAGFVTDISFDNISDEELLAVLGTVIGHEITHGFDTYGYLYDKDGYYNDWWTQKDKDQFQLRADKLARYYSSMIPYPGETSYDGNKVKSEAIADMGGMKCMLNIAEKNPDFDYGLFFESYARLWRTLCTYNHEAESADDVHPLSYMRVNTVLQQFDKFFETYNVSEGDGMYLSPEKRVLVW